MLSKSFGPVKPLRAMFLPQNSLTQKASVMCDTRWSHRPLYQFVLDINLPAAEKLVLLSVASYRDHLAHEAVHFGTMQPDVYDIQEDTCLPQPVVSKILRVLYDAGYITIDAMVRGPETYLVERSLPLFFEYFSLSRILEYVSEDEEDEVSALLDRLDKVSLEIREALTFDIRSLERIKHMYPGLHRTHVQPWLRLENKRSIKRPEGKEVHMP